jgi:hypothetical protein
MRNEGRRKSVLEKGPRERQKVIGITVDAEKLTASMTTNIAYYEEYQKNT